MHRARWDQIVLRRDINARDASMPPADAYLPSKLHDQLIPGILLEVPELERRRTQQKSGNVDPMEDDAAFLIQR